MPHKPLNVLILDDEAHANELLEIYLKKYCPKISKIWKCTSTVEARKLLLKHKSINVLFIDIEMPDENGLEFLFSIDVTNIYPIFVTSHSEHSIKAFKAEAFDYLLKPVQTDELKETIERVCARLNSNSIDENLHPDIKRLEIRNQKSITYIEHQDIVMVMAQGSYSEVYTLKNKHIISRNLRQVESYLKNSHFMRCHNSYIVNIRHVKELIHEGNYAVLVNGLKSLISSSKKEEFMERMIV